MSRALLKLLPGQQFHVACIVVEKHLNVRDTEILANRLKSSQCEKRTNVHSLATNHDKCEEWSTYLSQQLTTNVYVKVDSDGKGKVIIGVNSASEVERLITLMSERT